MVVDIKAWNEMFQELMQQKVPRDTWTLGLDRNLQPDHPACGWRQYQQRAFGRFLCSSCQRSWASAQVQILCHMKKNPKKKKTSKSCVLIRFFGQRCQKCSLSQFETPDFSQESTQRILSNLVQRILERFYENGIRRVPEIPVMPEVHLQGAHDKANCEACALGICEQDPQDAKAEPTPIPSYIEAEIENYVYEGSPSGHATARRTQVSGGGPQFHWATSQQHTPGTTLQATSAVTQPTQITQSLPPAGAISPETYITHGRQKWRRDSAREFASDNFSSSSPLVPQNYSSSQDLLSVFGYVCTIALFTYLAVIYRR